MDIHSVSNHKSLKIPTFCHPKTLNPKTPSNHKKPTYPFHRNPFPLYLSASTTRKFQTSAHFGRPTNRRNFLRKKLLHDQQVCLPNHIPTDPSSGSSNVIEESDAGFQRVSVDYDSLVEFEKPKSKVLGESVLLNKLENWVDQDRNDIEYWGIGSGPIFTVYQDSVGGVKRVLVDEDEILRRSRVQRDVIEDFPEVKDKILDANNLAKEVENGNNVIARNSSVAKFVVQGELEEEGGGFVNAVRGFVVQHGLFPKLSGVGGKVLCVLVVLWAVNKLFSFGDKEVEYTEVENKMMRKIKARKEKEVLVKGAVEVIQSSSAEVRTGSTDMDYKIREIRYMARKAREIEGSDRSLVSRDVEMNDPVIGKSSNENEVINKDRKQDNSLSDHKNEAARSATDDDEILPTTCVIVSRDREIIDEQGIEINENVVPLKDGEGNKSENPPINGSFMTNTSSVNKSPRNILTVQEARDYLSKKHDKQDTDTESEIELMKENIADFKSSSVDFNDHKWQHLEMNTTVSRNDTLNGISDPNPEKKISKLKREMEMFGPQAVVRKYREYADNKEEDYLWWLDLPYILWIELYTIEDREQKVGFYSLEMAEDLELEPKPYHMIAFQDPGDCKNMGYIIQAHMDTLGNGNAFVVAQHPKEAFRGAKANDFGVTVIKKGEVVLNIDQTLEEVEEQIIEIGSKMYHDTMMR